MAIAIKDGLHHGKARRFPFVLFLVASSDVLFDRTTDGFAPLLARSVHFVGFGANRESDSSVRTGGSGLEKGPDLRDYVQSTQAAHFAVGSLQTKSMTSSVRIPSPLRNPRLKAVVWELSILDLLQDVAFLTLCLGPKVEMNMAPCAAHVRKWVLSINTLLDAMPKDSRTNPLYVNITFPVCLLGEKPLHTSANCVLVSHGLFVPTA